MGAFRDFTLAKGTAIYRRCTVFDTRFLLFEKRVFNEMCFVDDKKKYKLIFRKPSQPVKGILDYGMPSALIIDHSLAKHHTILTKNITLKTFLLYIKLNVCTLRCYEIFYFKLTNAKKQRHVTYILVVNVSLELYIWYIYICTSSCIIFKLNAVLVYNAISSSVSRAQER